MKLSEIEEFWILDPGPCGFFQDLSPVKKLAELWWMMDDNLEMAAWLKDLENSLESSNIYPQIGSMTSIQFMFLLKDTKNDNRKEHMNGFCLCTGFVFFVSFFVCILFVCFGCRSTHSKVVSTRLRFFLRWRPLSSWRSVAGVLITLGRLQCLWHMLSVDLCGWSLEHLRVLRLCLPWLIGRAQNIYLVRKVWWRHHMESCEMKLRLWLIVFGRLRYERRMILTCELIVSLWFLVPLRLLLVLHHGHF